MRKSMWAVIVIVVLVGAGVGIWLGTSKGSNNMADMSSMNMNSSSNTKSNSTPTATNAVTIQNFAFSPSSITVKKGTAVTWTNQDNITHTVTETDGQPGPDSGNLASGKSYSFTFNTIGTFHYHCAIHPEMTGTVTVTN